jgi:polyferredoxin
MGLNIIKLQAARHTVQMLVLVVAILGFFEFVGMSGLIYPFYFCYACPWAWASCPLGIVEHSFIDLSYGEWLDGFLLLAYAFGTITLAGMLFGRYICGWVCPIGALQDLLAFIRFKVLKIEVPRLYQGRWVKYGVLAFIPVSSYVTKELFYTRLCPVGGITGTIPMLLTDWGNWTAGADFPIKVVSVIFFFGLVVVIGRGWCRYLCPLGAWLSFYNKVTPLHIAFDEKKCVHCNLCSDNCPMKIDIPNTSRSLECIGCAKCVHACNKGALSLNVFKRRVV